MAAWEGQMRAPNLDKYTTKQDSSWSWWLNLHYIARCWKTNKTRTKIGDFESARRRDQQILWLQVAVQNAIRVAKCKARHELMQEALDLRWFGRRAAHIEELLQVLVNKLKDQVQLLRIGEYNFMQTAATNKKLNMRKRVKRRKIFTITDSINQAADALDNRRVLQLLENGNFADRRRRNTLVVGIQTNALQCYQRVFNCANDRTQPIARIMSAEKLWAFMTSR